MADERRSATKRDWLKALGMVAACSYLPFAWILFTSYPWGSYRLTWLAIWPVLPGLFSSLFVAPAWRLWCMGATTMAWFALNTLLASRGRWQFELSRILCLATACVSSVVAHSLFLM